MIIEIKARNGIVRLWFARLFFEAHHVPAIVEFDDAVTLGVFDVICEYRRSVRAGHRVPKQALKIVSVEDVVPKHESRRRAGQKRFTYQKSLREPARHRLHRVGEVDAPLAAVAEELLKARRILRRRDDE